MSVRFKDPISHCRALASIAGQLLSPSEEHPPLRVLLNVLAEAKQFIHFATYGISHQFIGALKLVAQRVPVRGIVSNADAMTMTELKGFAKEAPALQVRAFGNGYSNGNGNGYGNGNGNGYGVRDVPHQKLIVIDGLLAFKGSTNLTTAGWRKANKALDMVEAVTDVGQVMKLHNQYFSPVWAKASRIGDEIYMWPF